MKNPGSVTAGGFSGDELKFIVDEAAGLGLGVMAHANGESAILASAEAGVRSIEHGFFMTARALERLAEKNIFWVPTVGALARAADRGGLSNETLAVVNAIVRDHLAMIRKAQLNGVPLALGTDCVLPDTEYAQAYRAELEYLKKAGIPHHAAIAIACESGAKLLGLK
jgi:imidazolonepropionase-like amidohydrolase